VSTVAAGELERSPSLATKADIIAWSQFSNYVTMVDPGTGVLPAVAAATALSAATDDRASIVDAQWLTALNLFNKELGPGQVAAPGQTSSTRLAQLTAHAALYNRDAILDEADTSNVATMTAAVVGARDGNARFGAMFGPWLQIPGLTSGTFRDVPPSALMLGLIARSDANSGNPNQAAAGENGIARYVVRAKYDFINADRDTLNDGGVNIIRNMLGGVRAYGFRTLVSPSTYPHLLQLTGQRTVMAIAALGDDIMESFVFDQIDGGGKKFAEVEGAITGVCLPFFNRGALFGATAEEAFFVDTGAAVNTPQTISAGEIRCALALRTSPFAEVVRLTLVKRMITEAVA
jgi:phage tail sheath protein FI